MLVYDKVSEADIWNYWKTLFPEVKRDEELSKLLSISYSVKGGEILKYWNRFKVDDKGFEKWLSDQNQYFEASDKWKKYCEENHVNNIFYPLLLFRSERLLDLKKAVCNRCFFKHPDKVFTTIIDEICLRLREITIRTFITEVHIEKQLNRLDGDSKEQRYLNYTDKKWKSRKYVEDFYSEYQELLEFQLEVLDNTMDSLREMIDRIEIKFDEIADKFLEGKKDVLIEDFQLGLGDSHCAGKTVSIIVFSNGKKIVYKPRNLKAEIGFSEYCKRISKGLALKESALYDIKALNYVQYGFIEFISHDECDDEKQAERYYYRSGILMAMLYSLNAKDIHHENLIAHGEYPIMIDLEALFHARLEHAGIKSEKTAYEKAEESIEDSVYSIGLLPMNLSNPYEKDSESVDISGFGATDSQISPFKVLMIKNKETDEICMEKSTYTIQTQKNVVMCRGRIVNASEYSSFIMKGFDDAYIYIMNNKEEIRESLKYYFKDMNTRIIYRPTYLYTKLMFTSTHPDFMRKKAHRHVLFQRMLYGVKEQEKEIVASEINDMMMGDVPYFSVDIHTGIMRNSVGRKLDVEFCKTPFELVEDKIDGFNPDDLKRQKLIIENAFLSRKVEEFKNIWLTDTKWFKHPVKEIDYLELAKRIGDRLLEQAKEADINSKKELSWVNFTPVGDSHINYEYAPVGNDLYSGTAGIGLFFLYLWKQSGEEKYLKAAYACVNAVIDEMNDIDEDSSYLIGPFNGVSGYVYVFSKFYLVAHDKKMLSMVKDGLCVMRKIYHKDINYDIISGAAGAIKVCLSLRDGFGKEIRLLSEELIKLLTKHLILNKTDLEGGAAAWKSALHDQIYVGYAHGSSGIEEALASVYEIFPSDEIKETLRKSHIFIDKMYVKEKNNWKTLYGRNDISYAWCHGSPGILYSQVRQLSIMGDAGRDRNSILRDFEDMKDRAIGNNICYCHGDIGNMELVRRIAEMLGLESVKKECSYSYAAMASEFWDYISERPLLPYGLMLGISGVGYSLLVAASDEIPSILEIE